MVKFRLYSTNKLVYTAWLISLFLNLTIWALVIFRLFNISDEIILHFTIYFGIDQFGPSWMSIYLPITGLIILIVNAIVGYYLWKKYSYLSLIINYLTAFLNLLLLLATFLLILVNV